MNIFNTTSTNLVKLAALVWFAGVFILLYKSTAMMIEAVGVGAPLSMVVLTVISGLIVGMIKAKTLFIHVCQKNINRILGLKSPRIWQFYRVRFFIFLFLMITLGNYAYHLSSSNAFLLLALSTLELSVSTALFISGKCFKKVLIKKQI